MKATGRSLLNDQFIKEFLRYQLFPFGKQFAMIVKVQDFKIAGNLTADNADGIMPVGEPGSDFNIRRKTLLPDFPFPDCRTFLFPDSREDGKFCGKVFFRNSGFNTHLQHLLLNILERGLKVSKYQSAKAGVALVLALQSSLQTSSSVTSRTF